MKKILIVSNDSPYPIESGANKRTLDMALYLNKYFLVDLLIPNYTIRNHRILTCTEDAYLKKHFNQVYYYNILENSKNNFLKKLIIKIKKYLFLETHPAKKIFKKIKNNYDFIIFSELYFLDLIKLNIKGKKILDAMVSYYPHILETHKKYFFSFTYKYWIKKYEKNVLDKVNCVLTITEEDADYYKKYNKKVLICKIPVNDKYSSNIKKEYDFIFIGVDNQINRESIYYFDSNILPNIKKENIKIVIFGEISKDSILKNSKYKKNYIFINDNNLKDNYFNKSKMSLSLIFRGKGLQTKVLEGLSYRHLIIMTNKSNKGIGLTDKEAIIADTSEDIIKNINTILNDENLYSMMSQASYEFSKKNFSLEIIYSDLIEYIKND